MLHLIKNEKNTAFFNIYIKGNSCFIYDRCINYIII